MPIGPIGPNAWIYTGPYIIIFVYSFALLPFCGPYVGCPAALLWDALLPCILWYCILLPFCILLPCILWLVGCPEALLWDAMLPFIL